MDYPIAELPDFVWLASFQCIPTELIWSTCALGTSLPDKIRQPAYILGNMLCVICVEHSTFVSEYLYANTLAMKHMGS
jgi:hypothetical protein